VPLLSQILLRILVFAPMRADRLEGAACRTRCEEPRPKGRGQDAKSVGSGSFEEMFREFEVDAVDAVRREVEQPCRQPCDVITNAIHAQHMAQYCRPPMKWVVPQWISFKSMLNDD
jgi:hypothetical protein